MYLPSSAPWPLYTPTLLVEPLFSTSCVHTLHTVCVPDSPLCALTMIDDPEREVRSHSSHLWAQVPPLPRPTTTGYDHSHHWHPTAGLRRPRYISLLHARGIFVEEPSTHEHGSEATTLPPLSPGPTLSPPAIRVVAISDLTHVALALARRHPSAFLTIAVPRFCGPSAGRLSPQLRLHSHPPAAFLVVTRIVVAVTDPTRGIGIGTQT
ncbi:hypothetical protein B0H13DRAFT_760061 [Mycena leptocephala]|nr:hypothetical protein B0H13DRAFT_760061 [Mycena leptocephala]